MGGTPRQIAPLFQRLPHGPSGLSRETVARNQRIRMYGGMIESVHRQGYPATTVADVIGLAGVSRRAFYEQFSNKEDCFLATYDIVVARARKQMVDAWQAERGFPNRLRSAFGALLEHIGSDPKGARLVLVDSLGIGPRGGDRMRLSGLGFELMLGQVLRLAPEPLSLPPLLTRAIVGGVRHVAFTAVVEGHERELAALRGDLLDVIDAYSSPAGARLAPVLAGAGAPARAGGHPFLERPAARAQMLSALLRLTLAQGYEGLTDAQIAAMAGASTEAFHSEFPSKESCFVALLDEVVREAMCRTGAGFREGAEWPEAVHRGMGAFLEYLLANPDLAQLAFVELFEIGPAAVGRAGAMVGALTSLLCRGAPPPRHGRAIAQQAIAGALWAVLCAAVGERRTQRLPSLVDQLSFLVLAPHVGPSAAVEAIGSCRTQRHAA